MAEKKAPDLREFVILKGSVKQDGEFKGPGETVKLDVDEAKKMDPQGSTLVEKSKHEAKEAGKKAAAKAEADALAKHEAEEKAKAAKSEKGGK